MKKGVSAMNTKSKIYVLILIWVAVLIQLFVNSSVNREKKLVEQAMSTGVENLTESSVKAYGFYDNEKYSTTTKENMAKRLADKLGITSDYDITHRQDGANETTVLTKRGKMADTVIKVITLGGADENGSDTFENYIMVQIDLKNGVGSVIYDYKELLVDMYDDLGMDANTNIYMCSQIKGELTDSEKNEQIESFLNELDAKQVQRDSFDNVVCVYGYSPNIDEFVYQGANRVNVNIAFSYDSVDDVTYVHRAIPFVDRSF